MITRVMTAILFLFAINAYAQDKPLPLGCIKGLLINGVSSGDTFVLSEGERSNCETTTQTDWSLVTCKLANATAVFTDHSGKNVNITFDRLTYQNKIISSENRNLNDYSFLGVMGEVQNGVRITSNVELMVRYEDSNPEDLYGYLYMEKYDFRQPIQAARITP